MKMKMPKQGIAFGNNYLAAVFALFFLLCFSIGTAQVIQPATLYGKREHISVVDSALWGPTGCGSPTRLRSIDINQYAQYFDSCNHKFWIYDPKSNTWDSIHIGVNASTVNTIYNHDDTLNGNREIWGGNHNLNFHDLSDWNFYSNGGFGLYASDVNGSFGMTRIGGIAEVNIANSYAGNTSGADFNPDNSYLYAGLKRIRAGYDSIGIVTKDGKFALDSLNRQTNLDDSAIVWSQSHHSVGIKRLPAPFDSTSLSNRINLKADKSIMLSINGTGYDLSANRSWTIPAYTGIIANAPLTNSAVGNGDGTFTAHLSADTSSGGSHLATQNFVNNQIGADTAYLHNKLISTFAKNAGRDSIILTLNDGTRFAAKDSIGSGGGAALDSAYKSLTVGYAPNIIGTLVNTDFTIGSLPSGYTVGSGLTATYTGSKTHIVGASSIGPPAIGNITTAYTSGIQYNTKRMPYEKIDFSMNIVPQTKAANNIVEVSKGILGYTLFGAEVIAWDLSNSSTSGRVTINASYNSIPTFNGSIDSTSKMSFNVGDSLVLYYHKDGWSVTAGIINKTQGTKSVAYFNKVWNGSGGLYNLIFLNGTYDLTAVKISSFDRKGGVWWFGDSQTGGFGNSQECRRFANQVMGNNYKYFSVWGLPSLEAKYAVQGGLQTEILNDAQPSKIVFALGYNDESASEGAPTTKVNVDSLIYPAIRSIGAGNVSLMGIIPRPNISTDIYNDSLSSLAITRGITFYNIRPLLLDGSGFFNTAYDMDGVHINDAGSSVISNYITSLNGFKLLSGTAADSGFVMNVYGLPTAQTSTVIGLVGVQSNGNTAIVPNYLPTPGSWIQNVQTTVAGSPSQGAQIHINQPVISDSALFVHNATGLLIGFNGGTSNSAGTTGSNILLTNQGVSGVGYPQLFPAISGNSNVFLQANTNKSGYNGGISGNNNLLIQSLLGSSTTLTGSNNTLINNTSSTNLITSGARNIFIGSAAGKGTTTGADNIILSNSQTNSANVSHSIMIGDADYGTVTANTVCFSTGTLTGSFYPVGASAYGGTPAVLFPINLNGGNVNGFNTAFYGSAASSSTSTGMPGDFEFKTVTPGAHNVWTTRLLIDTNVNVSTNLSVTGNTNLNGTLKIGTSSTSGYVWTATDASGNGHWAASSGGGGGSTLISAGSGYVIGKTGTDSVKTVTAGYGIIWDSAVFNQVRAKVDTTTIFPAVRATIPGGGTTYTGTAPIVVTGSVISVNDASVSNSGVINTGTQSFAGAKSFASNSFMSDIRFDGGGIMYFSSTSSALLRYSGGVNVLNVTAGQTQIGNSTGVINVFSNGSIGMGTASSGSYKRYLFGPNTGNGLTTGDFNLAFGDQSLFSTSTGTHNIAFGAQYAGSGASRGNSGNHTQCIFFGDYTGATTNATALSNTTIIGYDLRTDLSNALVLGRSDQLVMIGNGTSAGSGAALQIDGTTKGFLNSRMTTTQQNAISSPATGLAIYNTDLNINSVYNGSSWNQTSMFGYKAATANYTLTSTDFTLDFTTNTDTATLPSAVGIQGRKYTVIVTANTTAQIKTTSSQNINGGTVYNLTGQYKYATFQSNNVGWIVIANNGMGWVVILCLLPTLLFRRKEFYKSIKRA